MPTSRGAGSAQRGFEYKIYKKGGKVSKYAEGGEVDLEVRRPAFATETLPTSPKRRMKRRMEKKSGMSKNPVSDTEKMKTIVSDMAREERVRKAEMPSEYLSESSPEYKKGGVVKKYAKGGSCRGMGAATKGGDYKIK